jgi:hypothetical protein
LSFAEERIGPLAAIIVTVFYLLALYLFALPNTPENPFASIYSETLIKTTSQHLLLLVGFDTLIYRKYYDTPPILVGHQAKPQPGLAKVHHEEHDAKSISGDIVSAKPVDDKPVVLVSDKLVEVKPLIAEGKDMSTCVPLPVHVDMGVQTYDGGVDRVLVHMVP